MSRRGEAVTFGLALAWAVVLAAAVAYRAFVEPNSQTGAPTPHDIPPACCLPEPQRPAIPAIKANARTAALTMSYNASGQQLFAQFAASPGNIVFSPYSIGSAMAMALTGARGETAAEMAKVLMYRPAAEDIDAANSELLAILNGNKRPAKLLTANALMLSSRGDLISSNYAALLRTEYGAKVFKGAGLDAINGWVSRKTEGKIGKLLDQPNPEAAAVLLNAVYFKDNWESAFDEKSTRYAAFNRPPLQQVLVQTMHRTGDYALVARDGYRALRLPYKDPTVGMVVVLPHKIDGLQEVMGRIDTDELLALFSAFHTEPKKYVALSLPRFKAEFKADLAPAFRLAGMKNAFDPDNADFSGMTGRPASEARLDIGQIVHRAVIQVAEESGEAAAATAVELAVATARYNPQAPNSEPFRVDRPFLFYVVDDATGAILFQGRVTDPSVAPAQISERCLPLVMDRQIMRCEKTLDNFVVTTWLYRGRFHWMTVEAPDFASHVDSILAYFSEMIPQLMPSLPESFSRAAVQKIIDDPALGYTDVHIRIGCLEWMAKRRFGRELQIQVDQAKVWARPGEEVPRSCD
jgi:serpin B